MKNFQKGFAIPLLLITVIALLVIAGGVYLFINKKAEVPVIVDTGTQQSNQVQQQTSTTGWKTFSNTSFTFSYPDILSLKQAGETITLSHSIAYKHNDFGNMKGGPEAVLDRFTDFNLSLNIVNQNSNDMKATKEKDGYGFQPFNIGSLNGFTTTEGVEGSGQDIYYFTVSSNKTLVVTYMLVPELTTFNGEYQTYLKLPGIILPNQAEQFFTRILSSLCTEYTRNGSMGSCKQPSTTMVNWKTYTNTKYGFEIQYPAGSQINDGLDSNSPGISFSLPDSSDATSYIFYVYVATKAWYNLGTPNAAFKSPANCDDFGSKTTTSVNINGINFIKGDDSSATTAHRSNATEYCILKGEIAYKLTPSIQNSRINGTGRGSAVYNELDPTINVDKNAVLNQMLSSFKFTPITSATIEKASGIIKSVYNKSGNNYIDIDYIEWNPNWVPGGGGNGPAYQNANSQIRTYEISPNAKFIAGSPATTPVTFQGFSNLFISTGIVNGVSTYNYQKYNPWDIVITDGIVTQISEHFLP